MNVEIELARATFILGLVATALVYEKWRILTGGTITGSYLAYLLSVGAFQDILAWFVFALIGYAAVTLVAHFFAFPRSWLFYITIVAPASLHALMVSLGEFEIFGGLTSYLVAGMYVTSGLTAYDFKRQGIIKTMAVLTLIVFLVLIIIIPLRLVIGSIGELQFPETYVSTPPIVMLIGILAAALVTVNFRLGTAGIIGAVFLFQILSFETLLVVIGTTVIGTEIYKRVSRWFLLTPRQETHAILIVGGISSWFALFWADWIGIPGAAATNEYSLEPIIVIGLMILESSRIGYRKSFGGTALVVLAVVIANFMVTLGGAIQVVGLIGLVTAILVSFSLGLEKISQDIGFEIKNSRKYRILTHPNNQKFLKK